MQRKQKKAGTLPGLLMLAAIVVIGSIVYRAAVKPDDSPPSRDASVQPTTSGSQGEIQLSEEEKIVQDTERKTDLVRSVVEEQFEFEMVDVQQVGKYLEVKVVSSAVVIDEDSTEPPENWDDIQRMMVSAQANVRDILDMNGNSIQLHLMAHEDAAYPVMTICGGRITYNLFQSKEEPSATPSQATTVYVWIPQDGDKYHYDENCSGMILPLLVSRDYALSAGYTACQKCA